jgi:hypothetical protein
MIILYNRLSLCPFKSGIRDTRHAGPACPALFHRGFFSQLKHYIKKESPNTYKDIYNVISNILEKKITKEHLTNYLKHSYKIYKS